MPEGFRAHQEPRERVASLVLVVQQVWTVQAVLEALQALLEPQDKQAQGVSLDPRVIQVPQDRREPQDRVDRLVQQDRPAPGPQGLQDRVV